MGESLEYVTECGVNYLRIRQEGVIDYRVEMLLQNRPKGLLAMEFRQMDEESWLYCRIGGVQSLRQCLEKERLGEAALRRFFGTVEQVCRSMEEYLLPFEGLVLDPAHIYVRTGGLREFYWTYGAGESGGSAEALLEYLLDHIDYNDRECVRLLYFLYQEYRNREGGIEGVRECWKLAQGQQENAFKENMLLKMADTEKNVRQTERTGRSERQGQGQQEAEYFQTGRRIQKEEKHRGMSERLREMLREKLSIRIPEGLKRNLPFRAASFAEESFQEKFPKEKLLKEKFFKEEFSTEEYPAEKMPAEGYPQSTPTVLLTGGMTSGGIYCLKARTVTEEDILLTEYPFFIGKDDKSVDRQISDSFVSRFHARIDREGEEILLMDLNSTNGTFLNRERLVPYEARKLAEGDSVIFAHREYEFCFLY